MGGSSESESRSGPQDMQSPEYVGMRQPTAETVGQMLGWNQDAEGNWQAGDVFQGGVFSNIPSNAELSPGMTDAERRTLEMLQSNVEGRSENQLVRDRLLSDTMSGAFLAEDSPYLSRAIEAVNRPLQQQLEQQQLANQALFNRQGQVIQSSSPFMREENRLFNESQQAQADAAARMALPWIEGERQRQLEAAEEQRHVDTADYDAILANLEAQALPRLIEQYGVAEGQRIFNDRMALAMQLLGITMGGTQPALGQESYTKSESTRVF